MTRAMIFAILLMLSMVSYAQTACPQGVGPGDPRCGPGGSGGGGGIFLQERFTRGGRQHGALRQRIRTPETSVHPRASSVAETHVERRSRNARRWGTWNASSSSPTRTVARWWLKWLMISRCHQHRPIRARRLSRSHPSSLSRAAHVEMEVVPVK